MQRSAKVTLKFLTKAKRDRLATLLRRYRSAVNFFDDLSLPAVTALAAAHGPPADPPYLRDLRRRLVARRLRDEASRPS